MFQMARTSFFFIIFVNDLPLHTDFCDLDLFTDYSTMSTSNASISMLVNLILADLRNLMSGARKMT